jgi:EmrB/QacA subfamily drug resistance transporter
VSGATAQPAGERARASRVAPFVVAACMFMENLDATAIVTALPAMAAAFGVDVATMGLGVSCYLVAAVIALPLAPWLADRWGTRRVMAGGVLGFILASMLCGFSDSLPAFVAARMAQGGAAALMSPVGRLSVLRDTPKSGLVHVIAILTWPALIAPILGPPVGGLLTEAASWRWIFFLNLPIGVLGLFAVWRHIPEQTAPRRPFDWLGFALYACALSAALAGLELIGSGHPAAGATALALGVGVGLIALRHLRSAKAPLVNLSPMAIRSFSVSAFGAGTLSRIAIGATPFLLPLMFQLRYGLSPSIAGALTLVYFVGNLATKLFTTALLRRFGFRTILAANGALVAVTVAACAAAAFQLPLVVTAAILFVAGATRSLQFTALNTLTFADVPPALTGDAGTLSTLAQQIGTTLGVALAATLLGAASTLGEGDSAGSAFALTFACLAVIAAAAVPLYLRLPRGVGADTSGATAAEPEGRSQ